MAKKQSQTRRFYTPEEDEMILDLMGQYPTNLGIAFEQAGLKLGRTSASVSGHYYSKIKADPNLKPIMALATNRGVVINTKTVARKDNGLSAFDVATTAVDMLTVDEKKAIIRYMLRKY